ncbi:MAG: Cof-type HAD-IIB family hydrolase [Enterococcus sp.]
MENYRAITFFDLDGTLLDGTSQITPEIAQAMNDLKKNKVLPVIATGRTEAEIQHVFTDSGITSSVTMNGSFIRVDGQEVYSNTISTSECQRMLDLVNEQGHQLAYYNNQRIWCTGHDQTLVNAYNFIHSKAPEIDPLGFNHEPVNMLLVLSEDGDHRYHEQFPEMTFYRNGPYSIDTVNKGISKGTGVARLKERLGLENVPTFGFGDGPNDLALLQACDNKIAMGNAYDGLKEVADFITKKNTDHGIVHALKHFDLI